jgi:hypothetical protein
MTRPFKSIWTDFEVSGVKDSAFKMHPGSHQRFGWPEAKSTFRNVRKVWPNQEGRELISRNRGIDPRAWT